MRLPQLATVLIATVALGGTAYSQAPVTRPEPQPASEAPRPSPAGLPTPNQPEVAAKVRCYRDNTSAVGIIGVKVCQTNAERDAAESKVKYKSRFMREFAKEYLTQQQLMSLYSGGQGGVR